MQVQQDQSQYLEMIQALVGSISRLTLPTAAGLIPQIMPNRRHYSSNNTDTVTQQNSQVQHRSDDQA